MTVTMNNFVLTFMGYCIELLQINQLTLFFVIALHYVVRSQGYLN